MMIFPGMDNRVSAIAAIDNGERECNQCEQFFHQNVYSRMFLRLDFTTPPPRRSPPCAVNNNNNSNSRDNSVYVAEPLVGLTCPPLTFQGQRLSARITPAYTFTQHSETKKFKTTSKCVILHSFRTLFSHFSRDEQTVSC